MFRLLDCMDDVEGDKVGVARGQMSDRRCKNRDAEITNEECQRQPCRDPEDKPAGRSVLHRAQAAQAAAGAGIARGSMRTHSSQTMSTSSMISACHTY